MKLEGSCHCGAVKFTVVSHTPVPFQYCYCSICRKANGGGGYNTWYPEWVYPFASAIDTELPAAPVRRHIMLDHKASWVQVPEGPGETHFPRYPDAGIEDWHKDRNLHDTR